MRVTTIALVCLVVAFAPSSLCSTRAQEVRSEGAYNIFEEYNANMNSGQVKERLDALTELLKANPSLRAYIMSYGGKRSCQNEAMLRAREAVEYLSKVKSLDSNRLSIRNGGYRDTWSVELWVGSVGAKRPPVMRTISKRQVTIIKNCSLKPITSQKEAHRSQM